MAARRDLEAICPFDVRENDVGLTVLQKSLEKEAGIFEKEMTNIG